MNPAPKAAAARPGATAVIARAPVTPRFTAAETAPAARAVGSTLTAAEIENIMSHAGAGCPLGPCQGCPHLSVANGACTA